MAESDDAGALGEMEPRVGFCEREVDRGNLDAAALRFQDRCLSAVDFVCDRIRDEVRADQVQLAEARFRSEAGKGAGVPFGGAGRGGRAAVGRRQGEDANRHEEKRTSPVPA